MTRPEPDGCLVAELLDELIATLADWADDAATEENAQDAGADDDSACSDVAATVAQQGLTPVELAVYGKPQPYLGRLDAAAFAAARLLATCRPACQRQSRGQRVGHSTHRFAAPGAG